MTDESGVRGDCEICGERYDIEDPRPSMNEVAEFATFDGDGNYVGVVAHGQCGIDRGLEMA